MDLTFVIVDRATDKVVGRVQGKHVRGVLIHPDHISRRVKLVVPAEWAWFNSFPEYEGLGYATVED